MPTLCIHCGALPRANNAYMSVCVSVCAHRVRRRGALIECASARRPFALLAHRSDRVCVQFGAAKIRRLVQQLILRAAH